MEKRRHRHAGSSRRSPHCDGRPPPAPGPARAAETARRRSSRPYAGARSRPRACSLAAAGRSRLCPSRRASRRARATSGAVSLPLDRAAGGLASARPPGRFPAGRRPLADLADARPARWPGRRPSTALSFSERSAPGRGEAGARAEAGEGGGAGGGRDRAHQREVRRAEQREARRTEERPKRRPLSPRSHDSRGSPLDHRRCLYTLLPTE